jgi:acylphosphatase
MTVPLENGSSPVRHTVHYSGRVQGVAFRYTTEAIASRYDVTGFVRNLPDGRVELVAEGASDELDRFLRAVEDAMSRNISAIDTRQTTATGEFPTFTIAF